MALELIEAGVVTSDQVVTHRFPLSETQRGMEVTAAAQDSLKVLIHFNA
jgi:L-iditol 2-dehydrogenase